jgi:hypothetical protein
MNCKKLISGYRNWEKITKFQENVQKIMAIEIYICLLGNGTLCRRG